ncbi:MAG TPA: chemotaxis protein CheW [Thermoanaerobaculia bacterium]|nr:chemotaxis protein CheW [Thermoanaerobaculia bacterium]
MVDLVKLRKKAKERKGEAPATVEVPVPVAEKEVAPSVPPPMAEAPPAPVTDPEPPESVDSKLDRFKRDAGRLRKRIDVASDLPVEEGGDGNVELLTFRLSEESYAVEIESIVELVPPRTTTRVPNADGTVIGITSLRGTIVTVIDLRRKLGHPPVTQHTGDSRMIVVEHDGETSGFVVDRVSRVIKLDPSKIESHPVVSASEQNDMIRGVFQQPGGLTILLDLNKILG